MGKNVEDEANHRACADCTHVCQTTHGEGLPRSLPRFSRPVPDYALPSAKDCNMQIPAFYVREHIPNAKEKYTLVGVTGAEWVVTFNNVALKDGWKAFATDYKLEKGDLVMFALVAPKRFYVDVFDKFGMEKLSTREPVNLRGSPSTIINKAPQLGPRNESPISNFTSGADGTPQYTPTQALKPLDICAPSSGKASEKNGSHEEKLSPLSRKRALTEPVENHEAKPTSTSQSSIASDDSVQVRLAKTVLLKSKQKKLKKMKMSCTSNPQLEAVAKAAKSEGTLGTEEPELCKNLQNEVSAMEVKSVEDRIRKGIAILSSYVDPAGSPRGDDDETMLEKPCEHPIVGVSNDDEVTPDVGLEPQNLSNGIPDQPKEAVGQKIPSADQRQNEAQDETETAGGVTGEVPVLKGSESTQVGELQPNPIFQPGLVKQESHLRVAEPYPHQTCTNCEHCGRPRKENTPIQLRDLKPEPVTSENPETPQAKSPSSNAPSSSTGRVTEDQKQRALIAAKNLSATTTNRHATVVMRVSFNEKTYDCFVSLKCAEMLPSEAAELTLLDSKGVSRKANWNADRRYLQGPGWKDFVDSHNLQLNDVFVLEVLEISEKRFVLLVHIFRAHEMENLPVQPPLGVTGYVQASPATGYVQTSPAGPKTRASNLLHGCSPLSTNRRTKASNIDEAVRTELPRPHAFRNDARAASRELPEPSTTRNPRRMSSSAPSTPGRARAASVTPSSLNKRRKASAPNVDEAVLRTELPRPPPVASTADAVRADAEVPVPSIMTRPRRTSSSPLKPAIASLASVPTSDTGDEPPRNVAHESFRKPVKLEHDKLGGRAKQKAVRERAKLYSPHVRKTDEPKASKATMQQHHRHRSTNESETQVRTQNSRKVHYPVAKMLDRRKSVQGNVLFLVELGKPVSQSSVHKRMKAKQDNKGRWWVPHHHFTKDLTSCFIE